MKNYLKLSLLALLLSSGLYADQGDSSFSRSPAKEQGRVQFGIVNFKKVVEESKYGKLEQGNFENLKKQMESILEEREKAFNEISAKFNDPDYVDSLSAEAENELKHKFRMLNQEIGQLQAQYYQTLNQANVKILQKLNDVVADATTKIAKAEQIDFVLNEDSTFYYSPTLDISRKVIQALDELYDAEMKNNKNPAIQ